MACVIVNLCVLVACLCGVGRVWYWATDGFDLRRVGYVTEKAESPPPEEMIEWLNQSFHYLGRGRQSFAFESADGKYVLKLPRMDRHQVELWMRALPFLKKKAKVSREHKKIREAYILHSFEIAEKELKEETGLLYLHQKKTEGLPHILLSDRIGRHFRVSLDDIYFLVQKKVLLAFPALENFLAEGKIEKAEELMDQFIVSMRSRAKKGICNRDSHFWGNFGYDGKRVYQIDVGDFHYKSQYNTEQACQDSYRESVNQLKTHLNRLSPDFQDWVARRLEEMQP